MEKSVYISPIGTLLLMSHNGNLVYCNWISNDCNAKQLRIENYLKDKKGRTEDASIIDKTIRQLDEYFSGKRKVFDIPLEF